jgi:plastocyanin
MLEDLWSGLIEFSEQFIVPDWGALVELIPFALAGLVALYLGWLLYRFASASPKRRGIRRLEPVPPPGIHMPGPSWAPLLAAVGAFFLMFGVIAGGIALWIGLGVLVLTLLYWGKEAIAEYEHLPGAVAEGGPAQVPAVREGPPPPGVHMPPPSFRPVQISIAFFALVLGLVMGGWMLIAGVIITVIVGLGWLRDARAEYRAVEEADRTGHLDLGGPPPWPTRTFMLITLVFVAGVVLSSGVLPIGGEDTAGGGNGPAPTAAPGGGGGPAPTDAPQLPDADVVITADNIDFLEDNVTVPAGREFTIAFDNREAVPHNVDIKDAGGGDHFVGDIITGPEVIVYTVPALAPGQYQFICTVHPNMTGTMTAQE